MNSVVSLHLENEYNADHIARLFPKCKARSPTSPSSASPIAGSNTSPSNYQSARSTPGDVNSIFVASNTNGVPPAISSSVDVNRANTNNSASSNHDNLTSSCLMNNGSSSAAITTNGHVELCNKAGQATILRCNGTSSLIGGEDSCSQASSSYDMSNEDDDSEEVPTPPPPLHSSKSPLQSMITAADNSRHLTPPPIIHHRRKSTQKSSPQYKLRDSRIIEIAGGREVFSQSRTKAGRKSRLYDIEKSKAPGRVWELRARMNDDKNSENSRELTETVFGSEIKSVKHQHIQSTRGVVGNVVFDDIGDSDWRNETPPSYHDSQRTHRTNSSHHHDKITSPSQSSPEDTEYKFMNPPRVIGNLQIAEYDGSPRRYGHNYHNGEMPTLLSSPTMTVAKPGFPQRIVENNGTTGSTSPTLPYMNNTSFNYLYEYSETRKVLEEFFKGGNGQDKTPQQFQELEYELKRQKRPGYGHGSSYVGLRLAEATEGSNRCSPYKRSHESSDTSNQDQLLASNYTVSSDNLLAMDFQFPPANLRQTAYHRYSLSPETERRFTHNRNFTMSPDTTDCESNFGEGDSDVSSLMLAGMDLDGSTSTGLIERLYPSMPILEDGLSSGQNSDAETNNATMLLMKKQITEIEKEIERNNRPVTSNSNTVTNVAVGTTQTQSSYLHVKASPDITDIDLNSLDPLGNTLDRHDTPPPPAPSNQRESRIFQPPGGPVPVSTPGGVEATIKDIRMTLQRTKTLPICSSYITNGDDDHDSVTSNKSETPIWILRKKGSISGQSGDEDEPDTDLETDRLLGQQRTDDQGFFDEKIGWKKKSRSLLPFGFGGQNNINSNNIANFTSLPACKKRMPSELVNTNGIPVSSLQNTSPPSSPSISEIFDIEAANKENENEKKKGRNKEGMFHDPSVLIEGVLFRARYLGSTQLVCEGQPTKATRMMQAEEAVSRIKVENHHAGCKKAGIGFEGDSDDLEDILGTSLGPGTMFRLRFLGSVQVDEEEPMKRKPSIMRKRLKKNMVEEAVNKIKALAPDGETQPSTDVDLFISTEKIMVLNTELKEIMMDHALRTISYIADIGDLVVLMARRRFVPHDIEDPTKINRTPKMICHVFESDEAQFIAQSIGQAFQVAYMEFLKANGIEDHSFVKEMDYQEVLNSQEIFGDELQMFAKKELQKEVVVPKVKGEILGVVIVESGWGSMLPTVVIANLAPAGAAARCGQLNIGDQIIAINGVSLVGLPLSTCQNYIKNSKLQNVIKLTVVPCAPVVEVKIKRPDTKYQLGFSVQNGVICSLLRGGIAERGGVRVGHRIIEINNQSVVAVPHEKIVTLLATSVGEILMKTMPTSMFRLLTGQETPVFI